MDSGVIQPAHKFFEDSENGVPGEYFVLFAKGVSAGERSALLASHNALVVHDWTDNLRVAHVEVTSRQAESLSSNNDVVWVEQNTYIEAFSGLQIQNGAQQNVDWGLDRIDQPELPLDGTYFYDNQAAEVDIYVMDTGVNESHMEFGGRVETRTDYYHGLYPQCGHGTHVAGIAAGNVYGVAKSANIISYRVIRGNCLDAPPTPPVDRSTVDPVIDAIQEITATASGPSVVNMSFGAPASSGVYQRTFERAVDASVASGVTYVAAAGNDEVDACNFVPAAFSNVITVGASDINDNYATFSNGGECVDIVAPGESIKSAWYDPFDVDDTETKVASGTSMSSPFVAGSAAQILGTDPTRSPAQIKTELLSLAEPGQISSASLFPNTPNKILQVPGASEPLMDDAQEQDDAWFQATELSLNIWYDYNFAFDQSDMIDFSDIANSVPSDDKYWFVTVYVDATESILTGPERLCTLLRVADNGDQPIQFSSSCDTNDGEDDLWPNGMHSKSALVKFGYDDVPAHDDWYFDIHPTGTSNAEGEDTDYRVKLMMYSCTSEQLPCDAPNPGW